MRKATNKRVRSLQNAIGATIEGLENRLHLDAGQLDPTYGTGGFLLQLEGWDEYNTLHVEDIPSKHFNWADPVSTTGGFISNHDVFVDAGGKVMTAGATLGRHLFDSSPQKFVINNPAGSGTLEVTVAETFDSDFQLVRYDFDGTRDYKLNQSQGTANPAGDRDVQENIGNFPAEGWGDLWDVARAGEVDSSGTEATNPNYGTIITVGTTHRGFGSTGNIVLARYFPRYGMVKQLVLMTAANNEQPDGWIPWSVNDMAIQADGKILVAGSTGDGRTGHDFTVWRFNPDFTPDTTFGVAGQSRVNFRWWSEDEAMSIAVQPQKITNSLGALVDNPNAGKIVIGGYSDDSSWLANGTSRMVVARMNPDGSFDTTWGLNGILEIGDLGGRDAVGTDIAIQSDGKVLALGAYDSSNLKAIDPTLDSNPFDQYRAGKYWASADLLDSTVLARINTDGTLDQNAFGARGRLQISGGDAWVGQSLAIESSGKIVIGGVTNNGTTGVFASAARVTADGFVDGTYGETSYLPGSPAGFKGFKKLTELGNVLPDLFYHVSVATQGDDKTILAANRPLTLTFSQGIYDVPYGMLWASAEKSYFVAEGVIARLQADNKIPKAELLTKDVTISDAQPGVATFDFLVSYTDDGFMDLATILSGQDIVVTGPNGFNKTAVVVGAPAGAGPNSGANYNQFTVTYRITTDADWWANGTNNGPYTVTLNPRNLTDPTQGVADTMGEYALGRQLGQFAVDIKTPDVTPPTAVLVELPVDTNTAADAGNLGVTLGGGSALDFIIEYTDSQNLVNRARLGLGDVLVTGPSNFSQIATFVGASTEANAAKIRITYRIAAPGGIWDTTDNGAYSIQIRGFEVGDNYTVPNYIPAGELTKFNVAVVPSADVRPNAVLTNAAGTPLPAQTFTSPSAAQELFVHYAASSYSTSGTITPATFINNNAAIHVVSANPVFDQFAAYASHTSDGAGGYIVRYTLAPSATPGDAWAGSDNGSYVVRIESNQVSDSDSPPNYVAAADLGTFNVKIGDQDDPTVALSGSIVAPAIGSPNFTVTVVYSDDQAIDASTIDGGDLSVVRTSGGSLISLSVGALPTITPAGNGTPLTVTYTFLAPSGAGWNNLANGTYTVSMKGLQVSDVANPAKFVAAGDLGTFTFTDLPPGATAVFTPIAAPGLQNLVLTVTYTDEVGIDWTTIDANDITITRTQNGVPIDLVLAPSTLAAPNPTVNLQTNGTPRIGTYTFLAPGGFWESNDNGIYVIKLNDAQIADVGGAKNAAVNLGMISIDLPTDLSVPVATLTSNPTLIAQNVPSYSFEVEYTDNVAMDLATILDGETISDIQVVGVTSGRVFDAMLIPGSVTATVSGTPIRGRYEIKPDGSGVFDQSYNDTYRVIMQPAAVKDVSGNSVGAASIGTFVISITDETAPTSKLEQGLTAPVSLTTGHSVTILYTDSAGIDLTSINAADIRVISDKGVVLASAGAPTVVSLNAQNTRVRVTYTFTAPGGTWNFQDVGKYDVQLVAGEVRDVANNAADAKTFGRFTYLDAPPQATVVAPAPAVVIGTGNVQVVVEYTDEVQVDNATFDANDIQVSTTINGNLVQLVSAGAPVIQAIGTTGAAYSVTYSFLPLGGFWEPSDNGTYDVTLVANQVADGGGQFSGGGQIGSFDVAFADDSTGPAATLILAPDLTGAAANYDFTVRYTDATAVDYTTITSGDVAVVGPKGQVYRGTLLSVNPSAYAKTVEATYRITKVGGFNALDNGTYAVNAIANQVADVSANFIPGGTRIGTFRINNPVPAVTATLGIVSPVVQTTSSVTFQVAYNSTYALDMATIIGNDHAVRVTGPGNYSVLATYVSIDNPTPGGTRVVTYRVGAPGGAWEFSDNGTYTISMAQGNGVKNAAGGTCAAGKLGTFAANSKATVLSSTTLNVSGTDASDTIELTLLNGTDSNPDNDVIQIIVNNVLARYDRSLVRNIRIDSLGGNDTVKINAGIPAAFVRAGAGNDTVWGGDFNDTIYGDAGDDYIVGGNGNDLIYGNDGNDRISGTAGTDTIYGQAGNDNVSGGNGGDRLLGGIGNDTITGGKGRDYMSGDSGDDTFYALDTELDSVLGGSGTDRGSIDITEVFDVRDSLEFLLA